MPESRRVEFTPRQLFDAPRPADDESGRGLASPIQHLSTIVRSDDRFDIAGEFVIVDLISAFRLIAGSTYHGDNRPDTKLVSRRFNPRVTPVATTILQRLFTTPYTPQPTLRTFMDRAQTQDGPVAQVTVAVGGRRRK
jgi:hypothetical protein